MWTIITQEVLMKFKLKLMSTGRSGSNNDPNKQLCSCRFLRGGEKSRCGSFGSQACWSQLGPFPLPLTAPPLGCPGVRNSQQMGEVTNWEQSVGVQEGSYRWRKMLLHLVEKSVECFKLRNLWNVSSFFLQLAGFVFQHFPQRIPRPALSSVSAFQCLLTSVTIELLINKKGKDTVWNWL